MDKNELQKLIIDVDRMINQYSVDFNRIVKPIEKRFSFQTHNTQELTNAHYVSEYLKNYFMKYKLFRFFVRELPIKYNVSEILTSKAKNDIVNSSEIKKNFSSGRFSIDAYYNVLIYVDSNDLSINGYTIKHLFVEYKVSKIFKYVALATDFLKYKIYTYNNENETAFAFVCFDNNDNYPTILNPKGQSYVLLSKNITKKMFSKEDRIFIYIPQRGLNSIIEKSESKERSLEISFKKLNKITKKISEIDEDDIEKGIQNRLLNSFYCSNINTLKNNVITAQILTSNYQNFIFPLYNELLNKNIINKNDEIDKIKLSSMKNRFDEFERTIFGNSKVESLLKGLTTSYKSSFNIILLLYLLTFKYHINLKPDLPKPKTELTNGVKTINYNEILDDYSKDIIKVYGDQIYFYDLGISILIFIYKLYGEIFDFNNDGTYKFKKEYDLLKKTRQIQKLFDELRRVIDYKKSINFFGNDVSNESMSFFEYLYLFFMNE